MKILFPLSLFFIVTCVQTIEADTDNPFDTVGNKSLYDHVPLNALEKAKKIGIHVVSYTPNKTTVILKDGKKYYRIQEKDSNGKGNVYDKESGLSDHDYKLWFLYHKKKIIFFPLVALLGIIIYKKQN